MLIWRIYPEVWIKPNGEMPFLYGGNILKAHVGRWSEDCPEHQGVVVLKMDDTPLVGRSTRYDIHQRSWLMSDIRDSESPQDRRLRHED